MERKNVIRTGAVALAGAAALLGAAPTAASAAPSTSAAKSFSIEAVALPQSHTSVVGPDFKTCCGVAGVC